MENFIVNHVKKIRPLNKQVHLAYWDAAISGKAEDYEKVSKLTLQVKKIYSDAKDFALLKEMKESGKVEEPILARELEILYNSFLENQIEPELLKEIVDLSTKIEKNFSTSRGTIDGEKVTDNMIKQILKTEKDSTKREKAWLASKQVGVKVADDLIKLVKLRNKAAQKLGFDNFHTLSMTTTELDVKQLDSIFNQLYELTKEPFTQIKTELDNILAGQYDVDINELMPWHYHDPFFQETPLVYDVNLDEYFKDKDIKELAMKFFSGLNMPVEEILANSDLYEKEGKNPHAFSTDIDREGDVRILCNLQNNETWMETILHELGHATYSKAHGSDIPYLLRTPAHIFTTEAIAMFFGRLSRNPAWMQKMLCLSDSQCEDIAQTSYKYARLKQLIITRWVLVMYEFEKELYRNPDQDLNSLWWRMVEKYQLIQSPENRDMPDWAAKIHFSIAPAYYHNYLLGELFASQLHNYLVKNVLRLESAQDISYIDQEEAGRFIIEKVYKPSALYHWNEMIKRATGEPLTVKYYVAEFIN